MAQVVRFRDRKSLIDRDAAASLAARIRDFPVEQLPAAARAAMLNQLHRLTHPDAHESIWPGGFVMLSRIQTEAIWDAIDALPSSARRNQVHKAFRLILLNVRQDNGEVMMSRDDFAKKIGCAPRHVSEVMGTLERLGVLRRERRRLEGVRGPGEALYIVNPHVAWNGSLEIRKEEAAKVAPPLLAVMEGGRSKQ